MSYFTTKQTPGFAPSPMGGPLDFLTNLLSGGASPGASPDGGDPSISGENPEWWNKLSAAQKPYFAKNGAQKAAILDTAVGCPKVGPDGTPWVRNQYGWCGPVKKAEPGFLESAGKGFLDWLIPKKPDQPSATPPPGGSTQMTYRPPSGMSTTTKVAIGVGAVGLVAAVVLMAKKKKD